MGRTTNASDEVDLVFLEGDYRAGVKPVTTLADEYGVAASRINYLARKHGWSRDLKAAVTARAYTKADRETQKQLQSADHETAVASTDTVELAAEIQKSVILGQRKRIGSLANQVTGLIAELRAQSLTAAELGAINELVAMAHGQLDESECQPAQIAKRMEALEKSLSLSARVDTANKLATALKTLVALERQAVGLADNANGEANQAPVEASMLEQARRVAFLLELGVREQRTVDAAQQPDGSYAPVNSV